MSPAATLVVVKSVSVVLRSTTVPLAIETPAVLMLFDPWVGSAVPSGHLHELDRSGAAIDRDRPVRDRAGRWGRCRVANHCSR